MAYGEDDIVLAAEYALGTLDADERVQAEAMMSVDPEFRTMVLFWEARLGVLNQMVGSIEPRPEVWERIRLAVGVTAPRVAEDSADLVDKTRTRARDCGRHAIVAFLAADSGTGSADARTGAHKPRRTGARQRRCLKIDADGGSGAVATHCFCDVGDRRGVDCGSGRADVAARTYALGAPPAKQVAQAPVAAPSAPPVSAQYVALLQNDANQPAFLLTVDAATKNFTARRLGDAPEAGRSYELWIVSDRLQRPRSLGVIGAREFTTRTTLAAYDTEIVNRATYAVSVEPEGGSPTGVATGPVVYKGKLIEAVQGSGGSPQ